MEIPAKQSNRSNATLAVCSLTEIDTLVKEAFSTPFTTAMYAENNSPI